MRFLMVLTLCFATLTPAVVAAPYRPAAPARKKGGHAVGKHKNAHSKKHGKRAAVRRPK
jgi:hypothetical protein